ncbi:uncharacterized protein LDX57_004940 [Aspergillus melleus]|uniref:uncharacterized protein n=1 Tax=Aspergillus melleus TaxID=138277 RepID=UPI001E8E63A1|nr:uncharacterized protein LDX57_004940 [Aspergillus melleus]KAH8427226.1 hypothetical protein LDX57_004940 [Aspergillus melleus]
MNGSITDMSDVPELQGAENVENWDRSLMIHLRIHGLYLIVSGDRKRPVLPVKTEGKEENPIITVEKISDVEDKIERWEGEHARAMGIIRSSMAPAIRYEFKDYTHASELIEALRSKYYNQLYDSYFIEGLRTAVHTTYAECKGVRDYIRKMSAALNRFSKSLGKNKSLDDSIKIQFLLCNLGEGWETFLTVYFNCFDKKKTSFDELCNVLVDEEMRREYNAMFTKGKKKHF